MSKPKTLNKLPATLAMQRGLSLSDGAFFNVHPDGEITPVLVVEHGLRGTQNVNTEKGKEKEISNIQETESAKTDPGVRQFMVRFDLRAVSLADTLSMCAEPGGGKPGQALARTMRETFDGFIERAIAGGAHRTLGLRYARNLLNARWLWRNRSYAQAIQVRVFEVSGREQTLLAFCPDALEVPLQHFDAPSAEEQAVADVLARGWAGEPGCPALRVEATVDFGVEGPVEVYPSQNYQNNRPRGFARSLYKLPLRELADLGSGKKVCGQAALRDQKISNALRTIDTWYARFAREGVVTPVEPMGANLRMAEFLRDGQDSAFELLKGLDDTDPASDTGLYLLAILVRGGVFGKGKEKPAKDGGETPAPEL